MLDDKLMKQFEELAKGKGIDLYNKEILFD